MMPSADWIENAESALAGASSKRWSEFPEQVQLDLLYSIACSLLALATSQQTKEQARKP